MFSAIEKQLFHLKCSLEACSEISPKRPKDYRVHYRHGNKNCTIDFTAAMLSYNKYATDSYDHRITVVQLSKNILFQFALELEARSASFVNALVPSYHDVF